MKQAAAYRTVSRRAAAGSRRNKRYRFVGAQETDCIKRKCLALAIQNLRLDAHREVVVRPRRSLNPPANTV